jgi:uncharacterized protein (DUF433 family)/DNA-binding transcriptional MerR regulator
MSDDALIGVTRRTAARVIGIDERRLISWNTNGLVYPSQQARFGRRHSWIYGLEDLVQGKIVRVLEERGIDIRVIRKVVEAVRTSTDPTPLSSLRWATDMPATEVYVGYPDDSWVGGRLPGQTVIPEVLNLDEIRSEARRAVGRPVDSVGKIECRRGALGSAPVFAGTRVPVETVRRYFAQQIPDVEILEAFPSLKPADLDAAREPIAV